MRTVRALLPAIALAGVLVLTGLGRLPPEACVTFLAGLFLTPPHHALGATPRKDREISAVK